jgi:formylglycine-generating enzyme
MNQLSCHSRGLLFFAGLLAAQSVCFPAHADSFGSGVNQFEIDFVTIGSPGNPEDFSGQPSPAGSVGYSYRIGKFEISLQMIQKANAATAGTSNPLEITSTASEPNEPATSISWIEAARFVNWLNESSGYSPAYKFGTNPQVGGFELWEPTDPGFDPSNKYRNQLAYYVLPSTDEWYKAAYYDPQAGVYYTYPTGSNAPPIPVSSGTDPNTAVYMQNRLLPYADITQAGGLSPFGTMAQGGNVEEWQETQLGGINDNNLDDHLLRGGSKSGVLPFLASYQAFSHRPTAEVINLGFRVASVPEPSGILIGVFVMGLFADRRRQASLIRIG